MRNNSCANFIFYFSFGYVIGSIIVIVAYIAYYVGVAGGASVDSLMTDGATIAFKNVFGNPYSFWKKVL
jgi:hypothetical protein